MTNKHQDERAREQKATYLHESADDTEGGETQVLEWTGLRGGVEKRVEKERNVRYIQIR